MSDPPIEPPGASEIQRDEDRDATIARLEADLQTVTAERDELRKELQQDSAGTIDVIVSNVELVAQLKAAQAELVKVRADVRAWKDSLRPHEEDFSHGVHSFIPSVVCTIEDLERLAAILGSKR